MKLAIAFFICMIFRLHQFNLFERFLIQIKRHFTTVCILSFVLAHAMPLFGQQTSRNVEIIEKLLLPQSLAHMNDGSPANFLLQLKPGQKRSVLHSAHFKVLKQIDYNLFVVSATQADIMRASKFADLMGVTNDLWKMQTHLLAMKDKSVHQNFTIKTTDQQRFFNHLQKLPSIEVKFIHHDIVVVLATLETIISDIITLDEVEYVGIESTIPQEESRVLDLYLAPNTVNKIHHEFPKINGTGTVISIRESAYDISDPDLAGKHISSPIESPDKSIHATEMATIAAGAGNTFVTGKGVATHSKITSSDFQALFPDSDNDYKNLDAWVQNHSYGTTIENFYGALAEAYDASANRLPYLLHIFSSGNQGTDTPPEGYYNGIAETANLTGNFKMSKNTLSVGAVDTVGTPLTFSSRGPAYDGRIKPELVAYSTQGSSNAAAIVSGLVALLQQAYRDKEGSLPPSALVKALLINSAKDAGVAGIDFTTGFGNADAYGTLNNLLNGRYLHGTVSNDNTFSFDLNIPEGAINLKVTIAWNDPATKANTAIALVNDLDISLTQAETVWLPWILDTTNDSEKLQAPAKRGADHLNNVEQVTIENPSAGIYTIIINGYDVPLGPQDFYVAYQWDNADEFLWTAPTASDNMPYDGETGSYFFWRNTLPEEYGSLEYSIDNGNTWHIIASEVLLKRGLYRWKNIPDINTIAQARMVVGEKIFLTDEFTISRPVTVSNGFNCTDSVMLQWSHLQGADEYRIHNFDGNELKMLETTADTFLILDKNEITPKLYTIEPVHDEKPLLRTPLFNYDLLGDACYLVSFTTHAVAEEGIHLNIVLGTTYGVDEIIIVHKQMNDFISIGTIVPEERIINFLHHDPHQGLNQYRIKILLQNGQTLTSDVTEDYFLTTTPFVIFPNPVSLPGELSVFSKTFETQDVTFQLYKTDGSLVKSTQLFSDREVLPLTDLTPGLYLYRILTSEGNYHGRIVLR